MYSYHVLGVPYLVPHLRPFTRIHNSTGKAAGPPNGTIWRCKIGAVLCGWFQGAVADSAVGGLLSLLPFYKYNLVSHIYIHIYIYVYRYVSIQSCLHSRLPDRLPSSCSKRLTTLTVNVDAPAPKACPKRVGVPNKAKLALCWSFEGLVGEPKKSPMGSFRVSAASLFC